MARGINKVMSIGNLGKDPELTYSQGGLAIAKFTLATTEGRKTAEGNWEDQTEWHRIVFFGKTAESVGQYLTKGSQVYVEGKIHYDSYESEGVKRYTTEIIGFKMQMLGRREDSQGQGYQQPSQPRPPADRGAPPGADNGEYEDDLPF